MDALRNFLDWIPLGLPAFLFVITAVVFFHELGHYSVARMFGVRVETFSLGFGREILVDHQRLTGLEHTPREAAGQKLRLRG